MNLDLPTPSIQGVTIFDSQDVAKPGAAKPPISQVIPGYKEPSLDPNVESTEFFNKQMEIQWGLETVAKSISFLSDELQNLKFIKLVLKENTTKTVVVGVGSSHLSTTHTMALFSLKEVYDGALKAGFFRRPVPNPATVISFDIAVYLMVDYESLASAMNLSSSEPLTKEDQVEAIRSIIADGSINSNFLIENDIDTENLGTVQLAQNGSTQVLAATTLAPINAVLGTNYATEAQVVKTGVNRFSVITFLDRRSLVGSESHFKDLFPRLDQGEQAQVMAKSPVKRLTLELIGSSVLTFSYPRPTGLNTHAYSTYSSEIVNIKDKDLIIFNIGDKRLPQECHVKYNFEVNDGIRDFLLERGAMIKSDMGKLRLLLGRYAVMPSTNASTQKHQDIMPYSTEFAESHKAQSSMELLGSIPLVSDLELNLYNLERLISLLFANSPTAGIFEFIETMAASPVAAPEKKVRKLLGIYTQVMRFYVLNKLPLEREYSAASSTEGATHSSPMSHTKNNNRLSFSRSNKNAVVFEKQPAGYLFFDESTTLLRYKKPQFRELAKKESKKYLNSSVANGDGSEVIIGATIANGYTNLPVGRGLFSYMTPTTYVGVDEVKYDNSFVDGDEFFDKEKNLERILKVLTRTGEPGEFLQEVEGTSIAIEPMAMPPVTSNVYKNIGEDLNDVSFTGTVFENLLPEKGLFIDFVTSVLLSLYLPNPKAVYMNVQPVFATLRDYEHEGAAPGLKEAALVQGVSNQTLMFADEDWLGLNSNVFRYSVREGPEFKSDDIKADGREDTRNYPFFFNNLFNTYKIERLAYFNGGFVGSPVWKIITPADLDAEETFLCRFVSSATIPEKLRLPIYNEMFILETENFSFGGG